ncbi:MAG: GTP-binding protein, partial [Acidimicrobiales bacterium]
MHIVATAGHVDHGKSTLIKALTGTDPDRWQEERDRGLTIDLGFAFASLASGRPVSFIDVPGHSRFIANMLAGVGSVNACLFVVAATEGWKPQSEEHLRILELVGLDRGVVALTKTAGLGSGEIQDAERAVRAHLADTFLDGTEVIPVDAPRHLGMADLDAGLDRMLSDAPRAADRHRPRLWVDRSFFIRGAGNVITGTLSNGSLTVGDDMVVVGPGYPRRGAPARIRSIQTQGLSVGTIGPGHRVAVNLTGTGYRVPKRGDALVRDSQWEPSATLDVALEVLAGLDHPVSRRGS